MECGLEEMVKRKTKLKWYIKFIIFEAICLVIMLFFGFVGKRKETGEIAGEKVFICLDEDAKWNEPHHDERDIVIEDCKSKQAAYNEETQNILYRNNRNEIIEKSLATGAEVKIDVEKIKDLTILMDIYNLSYTPQGDCISFYCEEGIYTYNLKDFELKRTAECLGNFSKEDDYCNIFQWKNEKEIFMLGDSKNREIYLYNCETQNSQWLLPDIVSFLLSKDGKKIFAVEWYVEPHTYGQKKGNRIIEIDCESKEKNVLVEEFHSKNFVMQCSNNQYLYYVEQQEDTSWNKVFCLNLETMEQACIYETDKEIIGMILY